jgi:magnesium transporter
MAIKTPDEAQITTLIREENWPGIQALFSEFHPTDIADIFSWAPSETYKTLFSLIKNDDDRALVLSELEAFASSEIIESLSNREVSEIVDDMPADDAADVLAELSPQRSAEILSMIKSDISDDVRKLMEYPPDSAGGIMNTDVVSVPETSTTDDAITRLLNEPHDERIFNAYVVDEDKVLIGLVDVLDLIRARNKNVTVSSLARRDFVATTVDTDQEEVAHIMSQYDLSVIPVLDEDGRLVGRITTDDVIDVIEEEASEDIMRLAGSTAEELDHISVVKTCLARLPWLMITLVGGILTSHILKVFQTFLANHAGNEVSLESSLIAFIPLVLGMAGNSGVQSSTVMVRNIALGQAESTGIARLLLIRELGAGALMGMVCSVILFVWTYLIMGNQLHATLGAAYTAIAVSTALFCSMIFATSFGATVPLVFSKFKTDPAIASGPFVIILNDVSALLIYFGILYGLIIYLGA